MLLLSNSDTQASTLAGGFTYLPAAPGTPDVDAGSDGGSSNSDNVTSDNTPTLSVEWCNQRQHGDGYSREGGFDKCDLHFYGNCAVEL